jgi:hypothetical protein
MRESLASRTKLEAHSALAVLVSALAVGIAACQPAVSGTSAAQAPPSSPISPQPEPVDPATAPSAIARATESPAAAGPEGSKTAPAGGYEMCHGQRQSKTNEASRKGPVATQLSPAFLDDMAACKAEDGPPAATIAEAHQGKINAKGDCEFENGVACHYHSGAEFVAASVSKQTPGQGELHCIFPSDDPKSPRVYGGHVMCRNQAEGAVRGHLSHEVKQGAACSAEILKPVAACASFRCCDDGTLTSPIADLVRDKRNDIRPDFRICADVITIDCDLLAGYTPHDANSPALGGVGEPVFAATKHGSGKPKTVAKGAAPPPAKAGSHPHP